MIYKILLYAHITGGIAALLAGTFAAFAEKGSANHIKMGKVFGISLGISSILAITLSLLKFNSFLLGIGLFTLYLVGSGWLWSLRMPHNVKKSRAKLLGAFGIATSVFMIITALSNVSLDSLNLVLLVFAGILAIFGFIDLIKNVKPTNAIRLHGGRMGGAFIASTTAFVVTNFNQVIPEVLLWLGPTIVGSPLIFFSIRRFYKIRSLRREKES
jgi:hypothetical protein